MPNQAQTLSFAALGKDVTIWPFAKIVDSRAISIGDSVIIDDFVFLSGGRRTQIGSFVHIAAFVCITGGGELIINDFAGVSGGVHIYTGDDDYLGGGLTGPTVPEPFRNVTRSSVHIKKHAIIGAKSVLLPGVTIGEGTAIGANSLVTRDCEAWTVYAGTPAKPLKPRSRDRIVELEAQLRQELYDAAGRYIPAQDRKEPETREWSGSGKG